ncbi:LPXTG cell wall anchor domain-containing protein [Lactobacillus plantarum]|nr:LPXTG cell wall anchor domain-containing protein [Lactiplantibacillus plantarum]NKI39645.1 LPXTG cell wall anchor domain-containing protein [Lactiplantibacillus plantarum]
MHTVLPQTDESNQDKMTLGGLLTLVMAGMLSVFGLRKRQPKD